MFPLLVHGLVATTHLFSAEPFEDEVHPPLRFSHRELVVIANNGTENSNESHFVLRLVRVHVVWMSLGGLTSVALRQTGPTNYMVESIRYLGGSWVVRCTVRRRTLCIASAVDIPPRYLRLEIWGVYSTLMQISGRKNRDRARREA